MGKGIKYFFTIIFSIIFIFVSCSPAKATIVFSISNPVIGTDDQIEVDATISGLIASSCSVTGCYLQAELQSAGGYFGYTYNNSGDFVDYFKTPASTDDLKSKLFNFIPVSGSWTGKLDAKNNPSSSNYYGPGNYLLTFRRFSGNSPNSLGDSNSLGVSLAASEPTPSPTDTPQMSSTPTPTATTVTLMTPSPTPIPSPTPVKTSTPTPVRTLKPSPVNTEGISSDSGDISKVLGTQDQAPALDPPVATNSGKPDNRFPIIASVCILLGVGFIGFSIFSIIKNAKKSYTNESEKQDGQIS